MIRKIKRVLTGDCREDTKRVSREEFMMLVRKKAYELYEKSGCQKGRDLENWLTAEQLVREEFPE